MQVDGESPNISDLVNVVPGGQRYSKKYRVTLSRYKVSINHVHTLSAEQALTAVEQILDHILEIVLEKVGDNEKVRLTVDSTSLQEAGGGVQIEPVWKSQLTVRRWMDAIELVLQSNKFFLLDEDLIIIVEHAQFPTGSCSIKVPELLRAEFRKRRSIIEIKNADNLCMARALVVGKAKADGNIALYNSLKRYPTTQTAHAKKLISDASLEEREYTIEDLSAFERALPGYQLSIVSTSHMNSLIYSGTPSDKRIILLHHNSHFDLLTSLPSFFNRSYYCDKCKIGYNDRLRHRCKKICEGCARMGCTASTNEPQINCSDCNRTFTSQHCFDHHRLGPVPGAHARRRPICESLFRCKDCLCTVSMQRRPKNNPHHCNETFCKTCRRHVDYNSHQCFIQPKPMKATDLEKHASTKYLYFDFETYVNSAGVLIPNLAVVQDDLGQEWIFPAPGTSFGRNISQDVCEFLLHPRHKDHFIIAHNFRVSESTDVTTYFSLLDKCCSNLGV